MKSVKVCSVSDVGAFSVRVSGAQFCYNVAEVHVHRTCKVFLLYSGTDSDSQVHVISV